MLQVLGIAFVGIISFTIVKEVKPEFSPILLIAVGVIILIILSDSIAKVFTFLFTLSEQAGIGTSVFSSLLKIIGIGYITEYSSSLCADSGCVSIGKKIELAGKITILIMTIPIIQELIENIGSIL